MSNNFGLDGLSEEELRKKLSKTFYKTTNQNYGSGHSKSI